MYRREFLRSAGLSLPSIAVLASLSACGESGTDGAQPPARRQRVIVVGAGISGLAAARYLAGHGHDVLVLEARDRIGGRIWTSQRWAGAPVDLGASWIHGIDNNPIAALAAQAGASVLNKCYLRFPRVFWAGTDWLEYVPDLAHYGQWAQWINLTRPTGQPILLGFNAADFGRAIEGWSDTQIVDSAMTTLRTIYGTGIPAPSGYQITRWATDPYALGSYSFNKLGSRPAMRDQLAAPVAGRVHFAGEATSRADFATVHGAYQSGLRAASEITG